MLQRRNLRQHETSNTRAIEEGLNTLGPASSRPSRTYLEDWVWMLPAPDQAKVYYWALRSFIFEKDTRHTVDITDAEIAELLHRSVSSVERARKAAEQHGLVTVLEEKRRQGFTNGVKHSLPVLRTVLVHLDPPEDYAGPTNCYDALRAIRARQDGPAKVQNHREQEVVDSPADNASAEWDGSANLTNSSANLTNSSANLTSNTSTAQGKPVPQVSFQVSLQPTISQDDRTAAEAQVDGWVEDPPEEQPAEATDSEQSSQWQKAKRLLADLPLPSGAGAFNATEHHIELVVRALAVMSERRIVQTLTHDLDQARSPGGVVRSQRLRELESEIAKREQQSRSQRPSREAAPTEPPRPAASEEARAAAREIFAGTRRKQSSSSSVHSSEDVPRGHARVQGGLAQLDELLGRHTPEASQPGGFDADSAGVAEDC